jgi:NADH dehydrogenase
MKKIVIVGGGFAGVWAALGAAREVAENDAAIRIALASKDRYLTIRPRLYERNPAPLRVPLGPVLEPIGVSFAEGEARKIDTRNRSVDLDGDKGAAMSLDYDRLVLATGS